MKPTREEMEQQLLAYVEGTLTPAEAARAEVYLANTDPKLALQVAGMMADRQALRGAAKLRAPHDLAEQIMEQVERTSLLGAPEREVHRGARRWFQVRYAAAAAVLLLAGTFSYVIVEMVSPHDNGWHKGPVAVGPGETAKVGGGGGGGGSGGAASPAGGNTELAMAHKAKMVGKGGDLALAKDGVVDKEALDRRSQAVADDVMDGPVTVTLLARSSEDEGRLRAMLVRFVAEDEVVGHGSGGDSGERAVSQMKDAVPARPMEEGAAANGPAAVSRSESAPAGGRAQQFDGATQEGSQYLPAQRAPQPVASASERGQVTDKKEPTGDAGRKAERWQYQEPVVAAMRAAKGTEAKQEAAEARVTFAGTAGAPYHVRLRRDQFATLTSQFTVASQSGGSQRDLAKPGTGNMVLNQASGSYTKAGVANSSDALIQNYANNKSGNYENYNTDVRNLSNGSNTVNGGNSGNGSAGTITIGSGSSLTGGGVVTTNGKLDGKLGAEADTSGNVSMPAPVLAPTSGGITGKLANGTNTNGTLDLNGANTYSGGTTVTSGTLKYNNDYNTTTAPNAKFSGTINGVSQGSPAGTGGLDSSNVREKLNDPTVSGGFVSLGSTGNLAATQPAVPTVTMNGGNLATQPLDVLTARRSDVAPNGAPKLAATMPVNHSMALDLGGNQKLLDQSYKGTVTLGEVQKSLGQNDRISGAGGGYIDCIITLVPAARAGAGGAVGK